MHFPTVLLSALSAGALTFPTRHNNTHLILPHTNANIAAYSGAFGTVPAGPFLGLDVGKCVRIGPTPSNHNIGINWGSWFGEMLSVGDFTDDKWKDHATKSIIRPTSEQDYSPKGANDCQNHTSEGEPWRSVRAIDTWSQNP